jgi:hypothetical protein
MSVAPTPSNMEPCSVGSKLPCSKLPFISRLAWEDNPTPSRAAANMKLRLMKAIIKALFQHCAILLRHWGDSCQHESHIFFTFFGGGEIGKSLALPGHFGASPHSASACAICRLPRLPMHGPFPGLCWQPGGRRTGAAENTPMFAAGNRPRAAPARRATCQMPFSPRLTMPRLTPVTSGNRLFHESG